MWRSLFRAPPGSLSVGDAAARWGFYNGSTFVGTLLGGPIGGALGAFAGRQIDSKLFGPGAVQGPRVKDLTATTSSYGQPISRHFGQMRVPGTIIWSTELQETKEKRGGGKGKPKTTTYSYKSTGNQ